MPSFEVIGMVLRTAELLAVFPIIAGYRVGRFPSERTSRPLQDILLGSRSESIMILEERDSLFDDGMK